MAKSADAFRTISEVAEWLGVQTHVLRFWESKFTQVKPVKRAGGRRYYRPADMLLLGGIRKLLHEDGLTIKGVQKILREEGMAHVADLSPPLDAETDAQLDADLTARMVEDVAPPPKEAEVVPFAAQPDLVAEDTKEEAEDTSDAEPEQTLPSFLTSPLHEVPKEETVTPASGLPYPPLEEDLPVAAEEEASAAEEPDEEEPAPAATAGGALPSFMRADISAEEQETSPEPVETEAPASALPSFLSDYAPTVEAEETVEADDADLIPARDEPEDMPAASAPVPRVVDVEDEPDPNSIAVAPSALSKAAQAKRLTDAQRTMIRPLLAQLTALRDQMASNRREPR